LISTLLTSEVMSNDGMAVLPAVPRVREPDYTGRGGAGRARASAIEPASVAAASAT